MLIVTAAERSSVLVRAGRWHFRHSDARRMRPAWRQFFLLLTVLPDHEVEVLLCLMLLHESLGETLSSPQGDFILLADQER